MVCVWNTHFLFSDDIINTRIFAISPMHDIPAQGIAALWQRKKQLGIVNSIKLINLPPETLNTGRFYDFLQCNCSSLTTVPLLRSLQTAKHHLVYSLKKKNRTEYKGKQQGKFL